MKIYKLYDLSNMKLLTESNDLNVIYLTKKYKYYDVKNCVIFKYNEHLKKHILIRM